MSLRLYNTLTRTKETFVPIDPSRVRMYVCGPTVYDFAHIGNARPVIVFDTLFRLLRHHYGAGNVVYVRNITDVDDKINERAARNFPNLPLNDAIRRVTDATARQYHDDVAALGALPPTHEPRATEHMDGMRAIIERLVAAGFAYVAEDHVLFSPDAMNAARGTLPRYGALANRSLDEMIAGARVDVAPYKRGPTDFVLWKPSKPGEPGWPSPAGIGAPGRPGWHIECSAMARHHLGEVFDIHGGGIDLVFPHHENEIAQSCCAFGVPRMANVWMHNGFLQVEGAKMSKSLGNFVTIRDLLKDWPGEVLRLTMLKTHYRQPIDWTLRSMEESRKELSLWARIIDDAHAGRSPTETEELFSNPSADVVNALSDDLNSPMAIALLRQHASAAQGGDRARAQALASNSEFLGILRRHKLKVFNWESVLHPPEAFHEELWAINRALKVAISTDNAHARGTLIERARQIGFRVDYSDTGYVSFEGGATEQGRTVESLIAARTAARVAKNWAESDRIRDELLAMGVTLKDGKDPSTGKPVTTWEVTR